MELLVIKVLLSVIHVLKVQVRQLVLVVMERFGSGVDQVQEVVCHALKIPTKQAQCHLVSHVQNTPHPLLELLNVLVKTEHT